MIRSTVHDWFRRSYFLKRTFVPSPGNAGTHFFPTVSLLTSSSNHGNMHQLTHLESKEREVLKNTASCEREQDVKQTLHE